MITSTGWVILAFSVFFVLFCVHITVSEFAVHRRLKSRRASRRLSIATLLAALAWLVALFWQVHTVVAG
jgi:hypothetical protein